MYILQDDNKLTRYTQMDILIFSIFRLVKMLQHVYNTSVMKRPFALSTIDIKMW